MVISLLIILIIGLICFSNYQISSITIKHQTEQKTNQSLEQSSQFITSYIQKLEETSSSLVSHQLVINYGQDKAKKQDQNVKQFLMAILKTNSDLVSATIITKDGRYLSTEKNMTMKTSSDMMKESWYQKAISNKGIPVLTPAHPSTSKTKENQWVISVIKK